MSNELKKILLPGETTESVLALLEGENLTPTIYLSKLIVSDATGSIGYGATAPTGTDRTASIQAAIDAATAGSVIVWDIAVGISEPILIPSDITIHAPGREFGAILRAAANCPMFMNAGITTDASASKQNTFGKLDPIYNNNFYRVLDAEFINNRNITIKGGTWNGNRAQQTGYPFSEQYGFHSVFKFWGIEHLRIDGVFLLRALCTLPFHIVNFKDVNISDSEVDFSPLHTGAFDPTESDGAFQFHGPGETIRMQDIFTHVGDDHIALIGNNSSEATIGSAYGGNASICVAGVNDPCNGDIRDVRINNHKITRGIENTVPSGCMRFMSTAHAVDDVIITNQSGLTRQFAYTMGYWDNTQLPGNGNLGNIDFINSSVELQGAIGTGASTSPGSGVWEITGYAKQIRILNRKRGSIPVNSVPDIIVRPVSPTVGDGGTFIETLAVTGDYVDGNSREIPVIYHRGVIKNLTMDIRSTRPVHSSSAPAIYMDNASSIGSLNLAGYMDNLTNMVVVSSGTIDAANVSGQHTRAAGGSPLSVSSGSVVTSAVFAGLSYKTANGFNSGAGTLTNSGSYTDSSAAPTVLDLFTGTLASALVGRSPAPTSAGAAYTLFAGSSANMTLGTEEARFACNNSAETIIHESGLANCTITAQVILDKDSSTFVIPFRVTDINNQWQLLVGVGQYYLYKTVGGSTSYIGGTSNGLLLEGRVIEVKIVMNGSSIATYIDGVKTLTATDAFNATATKHGMGGYSPGVRTLRCKSFRVGA